MRFFWPNQLNPNPTGFTRLGRVLHWIGTALAIGLVVLALLTIGNYSLDQHGIILAVSGGFAAVAYFAGRALRYIFSGE